MSTPRPLCGAAMRVGYNAQRDSYSPAPAWIPGENPAPLADIYRRAPLRELLSADYRTEGPAVEVWLYPLHSAGAYFSRPHKGAPAEVLSRELGELTASGLFIDIDDEATHKAKAPRSPAATLDALAQALEPFKRLPGFFLYRTARGARAGLIYAEGIAPDTHTAALRELMAQMSERVKAPLAEQGLEVDVDAKCTDLGRGYAAPLIYKRGQALDPSEVQLWVSPTDAPRELIEKLAALWTKRLTAHAHAAGSSAGARTPNSTSGADRKGPRQGGAGEGQNGAKRAPKTKTYVPQDLSALDNPAAYQLTRSAFFAVCQVIGHEALRRDILEALDRHIMDGRRMTKEGPAWFERTLQEYAEAAPALDTEPRADEALPEPARIEGFNELAPLRRVFTQGDDLELAEAIVESFHTPTTAAPLAPLWHGNGLRRFEASAGVWKYYGPRALKRVAMGARGAVITTASGAKEYSVSSARVDAAVKMLAPLCGAQGGEHGESVFDTAPRGIVLGGQFVKATPEGLSIEPARPDHLAIHALPYSVPPQVARFWSTDGDEGAAPKRPPVFTGRYLAASLAREPEEALGETPATIRDEVEAKITTIGEWLGLALLGQCTVEAVALVVHGQGSNGKSVLTSLVADLFGSEQTAHLPPQQMSERFSRAQLFGAAVNVVSEMPESDLLAADTLKAIISGDTIEVERKHQDPFSFTPRAAHIFAANKLPASRDRSHGLWRRLVPVEFCTVFTAETRDPQLISALRAEFDLIVPWALECARGYITRGRRFAYADRINAWRGAWRADTDATAGYLAEMLETVTDHKDGETAETLWRAFQRWADDQGLEHAKKTALKTFAAHLRALPGVTQKVINIYHGQQRTTERRYNLKRKDTTDKPAPMWT